MQLMQMWIKSQFSGLTEPLSSGNSPGSSFGEIVSFSPWF